VTSRRLPDKTIEALRLTLVKLEQTTNAEQGANHLDRLKSRVIGRIAELEARNALAGANALADSNALETASAPGSPSEEPVPSVDTPAVPMAAAPPLDTIAGPEESAPELTRAS
jgi:hypothetical protein